MKGAFRFAASKLMHEHQARASQMLIQTLKCKPPTGKKNGDSLLALRNRIEKKKMNSLEKRMENQK